MKRLLSSLIAVSLAISSTVTATAVESPVAGTSGQEIVTEGSSSSVPMNLTAEPMLFSVTLPSAFPIAVSSKGEILTADNAKIVNNSSAAVQITDVTMSAKDDWVLSDFDSYAAVANTMALNIGGVKSAGADETTFTSSSFEPIAKSGGTLELKYHAKLPTFYDPISVQVADVTFTLGWHNLSEPTPTVSPSMKSWSSKQTGDFHDYKTTVTSIDIVDHQEAPEDVYAGPWDISSETDGSVMAWMPSSSSVTIAGNGNGPIKLPEDSSNLFADFTNLVTISGIDNLDFTNVQVADSMFASCRKLENLDTSSVVMPNLVSMDSMFDSCRLLASLDVSGFDVTNVTSLNNVFSGCRGLSSLTGIDTWNTSNVEDFSYFLQSTALDDYSFVESMDLTKAKSIEGLFNSCGTLNSITLALNAPNLTTVESLFRGCDNLKSVTFTDVNTPELTSMAYMFDECSSVNNLDLTEFDTAKVIDYQYMFSQCEALTTLNVSSFESTAKTKFNYMFDRCTSLSTLDLSSLTLLNNYQFVSMFNLDWNLNTVFCKDQQNADWIYHNAMDSPGNVNFVAKN